LRQLRFANEPQEGDGDVRSIDAGSPPTPMPACAKAARSRDTHGARGQWGDPVDLEVLGGVDLRQMDHSMARRVSSALGTGAGPPLPRAPGTIRGFIGGRPSRCSFLRASLQARRMASARSRVFRAEGFS